MTVDPTRRSRWGLALAGLVLLVFVVWTQSGDPQLLQPPFGGEPDPDAVVVPVTGEEGPSDADAGAEEPTIRGTVESGRGDEPLAGATVTVHDRTSLYGTTVWPESESGGLTDLRPPGPAIARTTSGADGSFVLRLPRPGTFLVRASKEGLADAADVVATGRRVTLTLHATWKCGFRTIDEEDRPVPGATVTIHPGDLNRPPRVAATTGPDGRVRVEVATNDVLLVRADGFATVHDDAPLERADGVIVLSPAWRVAGTVMDVEGRPVEAVAVRLSCWWNELTTTGPDGTFSFEGLTADTCSSDSDRPLVEIGFRHPDYLPVDRVVVPGDDDAGTVLHRPGRAEIRVTLVPPPEARQDRFYLSFFHPADAGLRPVEDPPGTFTLSGVPTGTLSFYAAGMRVRGRPYPVSETKFRIEVGPGDRRLSRTVRLLPKVVSVAMVRVMDHRGHPESGAMVWTDALAFSLAITDEEGIAWLWFPSPPGTPVALEVAPGWNARGLDGCVAHLEMSTRADLTGPVPEVTLAPAPQVTVRVTGPDGRALPDVGSSVLVVQKQGATDSDRSGRPASVVPGEPHTFRARIRPERDFGLVVRADGYGVWHRRFPPARDRDPEVTVRVPAEAGLTGRLVTKTGRPFRAVSRITATVLPIAAEPYFGGSTDEIDPDGRFRIGGLAAGQIRLTVFESARFQHSPIAEVEVTLDEKGVTNVGEVVVGGLPVVRGSVRDPAGRPLSGTVVNCRREPGRDLLARTLTKPDGTFELAVPIRPGCVVECRREGYEGFFFALTAENRDRAHDVTLTPER